MNFDKLLQEFSLFLTVIDRFDLSFESSSPVTFLDFLFMPTFPKRFDLIFKSILKRFGSSPLTILHSPMPYTSFNCFASS
jgi:hypothetical protein